MSEQSDEPALVRYGAGTDQSTRDVNLDVSGTVGPDYLGQETVTVDGDPHDRPGVRSRLPESAGEGDPRIRRMDTGEELPVLLNSEMQAGPIEGVQGSYSKIVEGTCARCGYDRLVVAVQTLAGEAQETCNACGAIQDGRADDGYRMPDTDRDRVRDEKRNGHRIATLTTRGVYDMEPDTGYGPYVSLVDDRSITRLRKDDVADLFFALLANGDLDLGDELRDRYRGWERATFAVDLLPDDIGVHPKGGDE